MVSSIGENLGNELIIYSEFIDQTFVRIIINVTNSIQ